MGRTSETRAVGFQQPFIVGPSRPVVSLSHTFFGMCHQTTVFDTDPDNFVAYLRKVVQTVSKLVCRQVFGTFR